MSTMPPTPNVLERELEPMIMLNQLFKIPSPPLANVEPTIQETPPLVEVSDETNSTEINETNSNTHEETNVLTNVHSFQSRQLLRGTSIFNSMSEESKILSPDLIIFPPH